MAKSSGKDLMAENKRLRAENRSLKKEVEQAKESSTTKKSRSWGRSTAIVLLVSTAAATLLAGNILLWTGRTIVETDKYVETVSPLIEDPVVQQAIAAYATEQFFDSVDVAAITTEVLPPRADFLAQPLADQLRTHTESTLEKVLANQKFQTFWNDAQKEVHSQLISTARDYKGDGTITINSLYQRLGSELQSTKLSFLANRQLPDKVGTIELAHASWLPVLHNLVNNINYYRLIAWGVFLAAIALALYLSRNRRGLLIRMMVLFSAILFVTLIAIRLGKQIAVGEVLPQYAEAVDHIYSILAHPLVLQTATLMTAALLIAAVAWASGPYRSASKVRDRINDLLSGRLHQAVFGDKENGFTLWVGRHKRLLQWLSVVLIALLMLTLDLRPLLIFFGGILMLIAALAVELLAAPKAKAKKAK